MVTELTHALDAIPGCEAFAQGLELGCDGGPCLPSKRAHASAARRKARDERRAGLTS